MINAVQKQQTQHAESKYDKYKYGAGAESKVRLEEASALNVKKANPGYYTAPVPEGRMRAQEQSRFVSPEVKSQDFERRHAKPVQDTRKPVPSDTRKSVPIVTSNAPKVVVPKNPFDEDDENNDKYDESKNPFADDDDESPKIEVAKETSNSDNPFSEYDNNLNPFE